jgi:hypothetical protein
LVGEAFTQIRAEGIKAYAALAQTRLAAASDFPTAEADVRRQAAAQAHKQ